MAVGQHKEPDPPEDEEESERSTSVIAAVAIAASSLLANAPELTPLKAPKMRALPIFSDAYKHRMLWGSYRSGLYFGMKMRAPQSLLMGLMWFDPDAVETITEQRVRHEANQGDKLQSYGWTQHDGASYGQQQLVDAPFNISIQMVKSFGDGCGLGGDWAVRVSAAAAKNAPPKLDGQPRRASFIVYVADEGTPTQNWQVTSGASGARLLKEGVGLLNGGNSLLGRWTMQLKASPGSSNARAVLHHVALKVEDPDQLSQLKDLVLQLVGHYARQHQSEGLQIFLPRQEDLQPIPEGQSASIALFQVTMELPGSFDITFISNPEDATAADRLAQLQGAPLSSLLQQHSAAFEKRFEERFLQAATGSVNKTTRAFAMTALSNLLGSMGHFFGASAIRMPAQGGKPAAAAQYWPLELYTAVPSRSFFPRGFLWDEGFHQLLVMRWDPQLSRDAIAHWLDTMNAKGWIPREQILGPEARARVPPEYIEQHPTHANPPSLMLPLLSMARGLQNPGAGQADAAEASANRQFLQRAWPRLEAWYRWFNGTQQGKLPGSYRWRGRDGTTQRELNPKTLMSGLDDYPRASHPSEAERHLDLRCWMALASQTMASIAEVTGQPAGTIARYQEAADWLRDLQLLKQQHWSEEHQQFLDYGNHTEAVRLVQSSYIDANGNMQKGLVREVLEAPKLQHIPAFGYVSLFPLLLQLLPPNCPELGATLRQMRDPQHLWTPYGLRSLSTQASLYRKHNTEHDAPYWRGPVWVNINFLALRALHHYCATPGPHADTACRTYNELREALLGNVRRQLKSSGYLWEQYDDGTGGGKGSHPFAGWTALVALIVAEAY